MIENTKIDRRSILLGAIASGVPYPLPGWIPDGHAADPAQQTVFTPGIIGGGGQVTAPQISPDGTTRLMNTDVYGTYIFNSTTGKWDNLLTSTRVPSLTMLSVELVVIMPPPLRRPYLRGFLYPM